MIETTTGYSPGIGGRLWWKSIEGPTENLPIVLLHGGPGMPSYYLEPIEALASERRVVLYDQLGCGRSDSSSDTSLWTLENFVEDLHRLTKDLRLQEFHLFGHSWGGMLALAYAAAHPGHVASLVLSSPLVNVELWCADADDLVQQLPAEVQQALREPGTTQSYRDAEAEFYRRHFCRLDPWPASLQHTMDELGTAPYQVMWGPNEFTLAGNLRGMDLSPVVRSLTIPNLWLCGSDDEARPNTIRRFSEMNSYGEFVEFADGTHCVHLEQSDEYVRVVREFLAAVPAAGT